jgi:hypothetical protein
MLYVFHCRINLFFKKLIATFLYYLNLTINVKMFFVHAIVLI